MEVILWLRKCIEKERNLSGYHHMAPLSLQTFNFNFKNFKLPFMRQQNLTIGLDIGSHAVKVCELSEGGQRMRLMSLGSARLPANAVEDGELKDPDAVASVIKTLIDNLQIKGKKVGISISGYSVILKKINLSVMNDKELEEHIQSEAEQYIPFDLADVYLDYQDLKTNTEGEDRTDVMLVAAKKDVVDSYLHMLRNVGLKTVLVDVDAFALENSFETNYGQQGNVVLVDIGSSKMNINIVSRGASLFARDVALGSKQLTEQIQGKFDLDFEEAESLKIGALPPAEKQEELAEIFISTTTQWIMEIKKAIDFYNSNFPDSALTKLVLSGGGAKVKGLDSYFSEETGLPVEVFNPFAMTGVDANRIDPDYLKNIAPEMAISMGLASRPCPF
ncbi:MAG: pilus assembly protein PilM [Desulfobulbaceae bacterium]|nr:pilus assembly protein PilM [Desulfobulbaceae bacterium]